jgi:hypothetical protein
VTGLRGLVGALSSLVVLAGKLPSSIMGGTGLTSLGVRARKCSGLVGFAGFGGGLGSGLHM